MKYKKGQSGNLKGRPKGAKDKITRTAKANIEKVIEALGGWEGILEFAEKNQRNKALLYGWYFKMLPSNVGVEHSGKIDHAVFMMPRPKKKKNAS